MSYDKDNNGSFETKVEPSAIAKGNDAQDTEPPKLTVMSKKVATQSEVTITATDNLSGVKKIYYSTDGAQFNEYTAQFTVGSSLKKISAFADDNLANRSSLLEYPLK